MEQEENMEYMVKTMAVEKTVRRGDNMEKETTEGIHESSYDSKVSTSERMMSIIIREEKSETIDSDNANIMIDPISRKKDKKILIVITAASLRKRIRYDVYLDIFVTFSNKLIYHLNS